MRSSGVNRRIAKHRSGCQPSDESVGRPRAGRGQLHGMTGRIAEVDALPAAGPPDTTLDRDAAFLQLRFPRGEGGRCNRERQMNGAAPVMRRNPATGCVRPGRGCAAAEQQQHGRLPRVHRDQTRIGHEHPETDHVAVERRHGIKIVDVERSFQNARHRRHRHSP